MSKVRAGMSGLIGGVKTDLKGLLGITKIQGAGPLIQAFAILPKGIQNALKAARTAVMAQSKTLWSAIPQGARLAVSGLPGIFSGAMGKARAKVIGETAKIGPALVRILTSIGNTAFAGLFVGMRTAFGQAINGSAFMKGLDRLVIFFMGFRSRLVTIAAGIGPALLRGLVWLYSDLPAMIGRGIRAIPGLISRGIQGLATVVARIGPILIRGFSRVIPLTLRFLTGWWGLAISAAIGLIYHFREQIASAWNSVIAWFKGAVPGIAQAFNGIGQFFSEIADFIVRQFWKLPDGVTGAILAVVRIVQQAAMQVYEWFSYLNPFARHSPSLVESVVNGMAVVKDAYGSVGNVGGVFAKAASDLKQFKVIAASLKNVEMNEQQANVAKGLPQAIGLYKALRADMTALNGVLATQAAAVARQQAVVDKWKKALDAADAALDRQQIKLDALQKRLDSLQAAYDQHAASLENYSSAPIKGMGEMSDAIFANELAQKKLRLEMLKWEQANGPIEDTRNKIASLQGDIEQLSGEANNLRAMGAGSDILGPINAQIDAMKAQQKALSTATGGSTAIDEMQKKMDELAKQGEILQLQNDIKFDPLTRQIDQLANAEKEMSYTDIINGINSEKAAMAALQPQIDAATAAVNKQKAAVDAASAARDAISARYDVEQNKLAALKDSYDQTEAAIRDIESALQDMGTAATENISKAQEAADKLKSAKKAKEESLGPGATNFKNAAGATDFPSVQGKGGVGREGGTDPQGGQIKDWTQKRMDELKQNLGKFDPFKPIKDAWNKAWKWIEDNVGTPIQGVIDSITGFLSGIHISIPNPLEGTGTWSKNFQEIWGVITDVWNSAIGGLRHIWDLFKDDFSQIWDGIRNAFERAWNKIGPELEKFKEPLSGVGEALQGLWTLLKPLIGLIAVGLLGAFKIISSVIANVFGPVLNAVVDIIAGVIKVIRGIVTFIVGTFRGDLSQALEGIGLIFSGLWDTVFAIFRGVGETLWGIVQGVVEGVVKWIKWLWDVLVGHSIIPDTINAIIEWFQKLPDKVVQFVIDFVKNAVKFFSELPGKAWDALISLKDKIGDVATKAWDWFWEREKAGWKKTIDWISGLPQKAWDTLISFKNKIGDVATKAWDWFWDREKKGWSNIITWFRGLPQNAWDNLIKFKDKIGDVATKAWDWFWNREKKGWSNIITWFRGLPQNAWDNLIKLKDKIGDVGQKAFEALLSKMKDMWSKKNGIIEWVKSLPQKVADALRGIGSTIADKLKVGWNSAANWINNHGVKNVNKALGLFNVSIPELPRFATGGVVPGKATKKDNTIVAVRSGEGIIVPELVRALGGAQGLARLNGAARTGQLRRSKDDLPHFADGGVVGKLGDMLGTIGNKVQSWTAKGTGFALDHILAPFEPAMRVLFPGKPFIEDWFVGVIKEWRRKAKKWGEDKDSAMASGGFGGGGDFGAHSVNAKANQDIARRMLGAFGWDDNQMRALIALWNGESGWNQYADNPTSDAYGIPQSLPGSKMASEGADWRTNPATQIRWGMKYIKSVYGNPINALSRWNARSPHWYDKGGILPPGFTLARNGTGKDELVLTHADATAISNVLSMVDRVMAKRVTGATPGAAAVRSMSGTITSLEGRLRAQEAKATQTTRNASGATVININGDLVMPNIKTGNDAETFIKNLKNLAG
jgi:phage-related protein